MRAGSPGSRSAASKSTTPSASPEKRIQKFTCWRIVSKSPSPYIASAPFDGVSVPSSTRLPAARTCSMRMRRPPMTCAASAERIPRSFVPRRMSTSVTPAWSSASGRSRSIALGPCWSMRPSSRMRLPLMPALRIARPGVRFDRITRRWSTSGYAPLASSASRFGASGDGPPS